MKKLFALILALSVLCSFSVIAQAADNTVADDNSNEFEVVPYHC